ncbi:MAG: heme ABC exporter ATP-binding protein CcmA [Rhodospirillales bacterium]|nr:heme ABC exporter ATP-binding protein CcmA [Rhodospirillales bacterium]
MNGFAGEDLVCERGARIVFTRLRFAVGLGGALVLVGPNGSGKSSLLRTMAGLLAPLAGRLTWDGADVRGDPFAHHQRLRFVAHTDAMKPTLTAIENLRLWAALAVSIDERSTGEGNADTRCRHALAAFGLAALAEVPARYLSAGQRRRLTLARLLLAPSRLWLLDEPRTALDSDGAARLDAAVAAHRQGGGIVVMALHGGPYPDGARFLDLADYRAAATC